MDRKQDKSKPKRHKTSESETEEDAASGAALNAAFMELHPRMVAEAYTNELKPPPMRLLVRAGTPIPEMGYLNLKPECAQIGDTLLCTHFQDVSLLKLDALSRLTVERRSSHGNYKIAACKSKNVFFVATEDSILALDRSGNVLGSHRCVPSDVRYSPNVKVPLSLACDDDKVSVIHTDNDEHETLTLLEWNRGAFARDGQLDMTSIGIDASRHAARTGAPGYDPIPPSTARLLSPLHFTALHGSANVLTLFEVDVSASGVMQPRPVRDVGLPVDFRCFANLESATRQPAFGVCALLEDASVRDQPPSLRIFADLQTPTFETQMSGRSVALCGGDKKGQFCTCRVVEHNDQFHLTVEKFELVGLRDRAFPSALSMRLARNRSGAAGMAQTNPAGIYPSRLHPTRREPVFGMHLPHLPPRASPALHPLHELHAAHASQGLRASHAAHASHAASASASSRMDASSDDDDDFKIEVKPFVRGDHPPSKNQGGSYKKRKTIKRKVRKSRKH